MYEQRQILGTLKKYFGFDSLRNKQQDIIDSVLNKRDTIAIMPTGEGKSLCFQLPSLIFPPTTIVISPLLALMNDQVAQLSSRNIPALALNSELTKEQEKIALKDITSYKYRLIYCSPEKLQNYQVKNLFKKINVSLLVVDEAHCICEWGFDFRKEYLMINKFIQNLSQKPTVLAVTATATQNTINTISKQLQIKDPAIFSSSPYKENIDIHTTFCHTQNQKLLFLLRIISKHKNQSGIIYCSTRKKTEQLSDYLEALNFPATYYHAGMPVELKKNNADLFFQDKKKIIVATSAFGMGIDKANIRFVIHFQIPQSIEQYTQEIGRAGRDRKKATAYTLIHEKDILIQKNLIQKSTHKGKMLSLFKLLQTCYQAKCIATAICNHFDFEQPSCNMCSSCLTAQVRSFKNKRQLFNYADENQIKTILNLKNKLKKINSSISDTIICFLSIQRWQDKTLSSVAGMGDEWISQYKFMLQYPSLYRFAYNQSS